MTWRERIALVGLCSLSVVFAAAGSGWLRNVPDAERVRANPYAGRPEAIAAGRKLFSANCAQCHGADALGRKGRPSLRAGEVQKATDGEIFWLLKNGDRRHGMPSWSALPVPSRWQIIAYVKSLVESGASGEANRGEEGKR